ncbi:MAG: hypothetical protein ACRECH_06285 [Nitrososphaerales archaeon]
MRPPTVEQIEPQVKDFAKQIRDNIVGRYSGKDLNDIHQLNIIKSSIIAELTNGTSARNSKT